jgi:redox-sensitive bicupin YhaK (pirin superfamily)
MEIVSYVLEGKLEHKDSMGIGEVLRPGEFQRITAGTGITHSEFNPSSEQATHFYQIWLLPERKGIEPGYEQKAFDAAVRKNKLQLFASRDGADGSLLIHQDARIFLTDLTAENELSHELPTGRHAWFQVLRGNASINGESLSAGDAAAIKHESQLLLTTESSAELMLFDLA